MTTTPETLRELAERGVGFDMNPTMMFTTAESMYSQWLDYFTRLDQEWRGRVAAAADALSSPPADDVREAVMNALACHQRKVTVPAFNSPLCSCGWKSRTVGYGSYAFDGHIADEVAAEVRPYGTVTGPRTHAWVSAWQERSGEISLRCSCGLAWKHYPMPQGIGTNLPGCPDAVEVRPYGTVTDAEVRWEYGCWSSSHSGFMRSVATWDDEATWREHLAECPSPAPVMRRAAGEWEVRS